ncbi:MAG: hypothetical protein JKX85_06270, partial [Phycisphaeraceae bacterium]|nr:hypothetical protein [Phycisphaeraceae bacterium]
MTSKRDNRKPINFDLSKIFDQLPPNSYEAECALLGSMILDKSVIGDVMEIVASHEDLFKQSHQAIYAAVVDMFDKAEPVDLVGLKNRLELSGQIEHVGGVQGLLELVEAVPSAVSAPYYAKIIRDHAIRRRAVDALSKSLHTAHEQREMPVQELMDQIEADIFAVASKVMTGASNEPTTIATEVVRMFDLLDSGQRVAGVSSGFIDLDDMTSGLQPGDMAILAARPSMGKTALTERILSSRSGVDSMKIRRRMIGPDDYKELRNAKDAIGNSPLLIDD